MTLLRRVGRVRQYFSADVLLTDVLCDNNPDRGNKRQFLDAPPVVFTSQTLFLLFATGKTLRFNVNY